MHECPRYVRHHFHSVPPSPDSRKVRSRARPPAQGLNTIGLAIRHALANQSGMTPVNDVPQLTTIHALREVCERHSHVWVVRMRRCDSHLTLGFPGTRTSARRGPKQRRDCLQNMSGYNFCEETPVIKALVREKSAFLEVKFPSQKTTAGSYYSSPASAWRR